MDKAAFLARLDRARKVWEAALASVPAEAWEQPGVAGTWSPKDLVAHVTWFEREMVNLLESRVFRGSPWWQLPVDERNEAIYLENRDRPAGEVLGEAAEVYHRLRALLEDLEPEAFQDPACFEGMPAEWQPWQVLDGNTFRHYEEHSKDLMRWLGERGKQDG